MNKKYIDFVPTKKQPVAAPQAPRRAPTAKPQSVPRRPVHRTVQPAAQPREVIYREESYEEVRLGASTGSFSIKNEPEYGVIEDFRPKFVKTEVAKRPLSRSHFAPQASDIGTIKSQNLIKNRKNSPVENPVENSKSTASSAAQKDTLAIPKSPFITKAKVEKRPLSKNVYEKKIEPTKEKQTGPVTIIDKPEKESFVGKIITIILTIILGAVAGAIAFLLLPK